MSDPVMLAFLLLAIGWLLLVIAAVALWARLHAVERRMAELARCSPERANA